MKTNSTRIVVYHCRNLELFKDGQQKTFARSRPGVKLVAIPCSGKVEAHHLLKTLSGGAAGVLVLACGEKACQFMEGSMRARKRVEYAKGWLKQLEIEPEKIRFAHVPPRNQEALETILREFGGKLETFGNLAAPRTL